jgi:L-iditol 2-dehydrogenase
VLASHLKTGASFNDAVVVIGAGPIGCLLVATAKARGAQAFIVVRSDRRREMVARFAPDAIIDSSREEMVVRVRELTHGLGADIVICANPDASTQAAAVQMVRKGGKVVLFGGLPKANPMTMLDSNRIHYGEIEVIGAFSYHPTAHAMALDLFARGAIPIEKLITHRFALDEIDAAFATANSGEGLKVLITP